MSKRTLGSPPNPSATRFAVGTYTGDGAATQAITGVGFQPKHIWINFQLAVTGLQGEGIGLRTDQDGTRAKLTASPGTYYYSNDHIISLDADGFTVGDGTGHPSGNRLNINEQTYHYYAWG